jgi:outer membrane murein-binding lipoprotein Lpp
MQPKMTYQSKGPAAAVAAAAGLATLSAGYAVNYTAGGATTVTDVRKATPTAGEPTLVTDQLIDAKIALAEARTETKFEQLLGEIRVLGTNIAHLSTDLSTVRNEVGEAKNAAASGKSYVIGTGIALAGFIIALFAFGWQILDAASGLFQAGAGH